MHTQFGKQVHIELVKRELTLNALTAMVNEKYGKTYAPEYVSRVLSGYTSRPMRQRIAEVLGLEVDVDA